MTKADLVAVMAKSAGGSKTSAEKAMTAFVGGVYESLRRGRRGTLSGFGTFVVTRRAARNGRHPRTGNEIKIPPAKGPRLRPSRALKSAVREGAVVDLPEAVCANLRVGRGLWGIV